MEKLAEKLRATEKFLKVEIQKEKIVCYKENVKLEIVKYVEEGLDEKFQPEIYYMTLVTLFKGYSMVCTSPSNSYCFSEQDIFDSLHRY